MKIKATKYISKNNNNDSTYIIGITDFLWGIILSCNNLNHEFTMRALNQYESGFYPQIIKKKNSLTVDLPKEHNNAANG